jgi:hypothetical protein
LQSGDAKENTRLLLLQWTVIIAAAWVFGRFGKRFLNQPLAVGEITPGILGIYKGT